MVPQPMPPSGTPLLAMTNGPLNGSMNGSVARATVYVCMYTRLYQCTDAWEALASSHEAQPLLARGRSRSLAPYLDPRFAPC